MKRIKDNISYLIGAALLIIVLYELIKLIRGADSGSGIEYLYDGICLIGAIIFILSNILGLMPVSSSRKALFDKIFDYLSKREQKQENPYQVPPELYKSLQENKEDEQVLNQLAKDICSFCSVDCKGLTVHYQNNLAEAAGTFNAYNLEINISTISTRSASEVLAVLIHECMHYVLREKKLWLASREEDEYLTDIATLYFGFGEYVNRGYILVGYIKRNEIRYIRKCMQMMGSPESGN